MAREFDSLIQGKSHEKFSVEIGVEVWDHITQSLVKYQSEHERMRKAIQAVCDRDDYCILCDNHPSHGHAENCILRKD